MNRPPFALVAVATLLAAGGTLAELTAPAADTSPASYADRMPVTGDLVVCPELVKEGSDVKTRLTVGTPQPGDLTVRAATLTPTGGLGRVVLDRGGQVGLLGLQSDAAVAVAVTATGGQAGAIEAEQLARGADGIQRGLANVRCESTSQDTWFVGGSTATTSDTLLVLVNPYDDPALVNLEIHNREGRVETPSASGIVVKGRSRHLVRLADLAPDEPALAVRVVAIEGRIAPAMRDARAKGDTPLGVDWVPRAGRPSTQLTLPTLPPGIGPRLLYLFAPGEDDAVVRVQTTQRDGQFVPDGLEELVVPAGRLRIVDLTQLVSDVDRGTGKRINRAVTLRVTSDNAPVLAGAYAEDVANFGPIRDIAYVAASPPLTGPALVTDSTIDRDVESRLFLAAPDGPAEVTIRTVGYAGHSPPRERPETYRIPQGRLLEIQVHRRFPLGDTKAIVITPSSGSAPIYAARHILERGPRGPLFTVLGLVTQPASGVPVPFVEHDARIAVADVRDRER